MVQEKSSLPSPDKEKFEQAPATLTDDAYETGRDFEGVGLSNAELSRSRRQMLDLVNRLQTTGYAGSSRSGSVSLTYPNFQCSGGR